MKVVRTIRKNPNSTCTYKAGDVITSSIETSKGGEYIEHKFTMVYVEETETDYTVEVEMDTEDIAHVDYAIYAINRHWW